MNLEGRKTGRLDKFKALARSPRSFGFLMGFVFAETILILLPSEWATPFLAGVAAGLCVPLWFLWCAKAENQNP